MQLHVVAVGLVDSTAPSSETTTSTVLGDSTTSTSPSGNRDHSAEADRRAGGSAHHDEGDDTNDDETHGTTYRATTAPPTTAAGRAEDHQLPASATVGLPPAPDVSFVTTTRRRCTSRGRRPGADSVYVAIDNQDGPYASDLPLVGSMDLNFSCPGPHTYWVVAVKGNQKDYKSTTFN